MRLPLVLPVLAVLGAAWAPTTTAQDCPLLTLRTNVHPSANRGILAGEGKATITVRVQSKVAAQDVNFKMELPAGLSVGKLKTRASSKSSPEVEIVQNPDGTTAIYWTDMDFKKNSKRTFRAEVIADDCAPEALNVTALTYLVNATDLSAYCAAPLAEPVLLSVRYPGDQKGGKKASSAPVTCAPTPAPSVNPATPFQLFGQGQRCLQAGRLAPFDDDEGRRLSGHNNVEEELGLLNNNDNKRRQLAPVGIATPTDCYTYCSVYANVPALFFFNWNTVTNQCFCLGQECTLIFDPDFDAYNVVVAATRAPSSAPTSTAAPTNVGDTLSPSASPSTSPTEVPSASPSASPTASPSSSPSASPSSSPSVSPSATPSASLSSSPTEVPSASPSTSPSSSPSASPSASPSSSPSASPSSSPSASPSSTPSASPSATPSASPSSSPADLPSASPSASSSSSPSASPSASPSSSPSTFPLASPSASPSSSPTEVPSASPSASPSSSPSASPSSSPSASPSASPSSSPSASPSSSPSASPSVAPTNPPVID